MVRPGTFERVYAAIKEQLRLGRLRPGDRLEPAILSDQLNASVTPVRDALHRLTGERLVEAPRHEGFRVPLLTESALRQLYAWHLDLVLLASAKRRLGTIIEISPKQPDDRLEAMLARLAEWAGPELATVLANLGERLEPYRRFEIEFLDGVEVETEDIIHALGADDRRRLRNALLRYHRRRQRIVPEIIERLYRT